MTQPPIRTSGYYPPPPTQTVVKPIGRWVWGVVALLLVILVAGGAYAYRRVTGSALAIVAPLHAEMVAGRVESIFQESDQAFQAQVGREKSDQLFQFVQDKLGAPVASHLSGINWATTSQAGDVTTMVFTTRFVKGEGTETIKWHRVQGVYRLLSYTVTSPKIVPADVPQNLRSVPAKSSER